MVLGHRIRLDPTPEQVRYFLRASQVARFAYNWALSEWRAQYSDGGRPSEAALRRRLNQIKYRQFPWITEVTKNAPQQAIKNLGRAYEKYFTSLRENREGRLHSKFVCAPKYKRRSSRDRFRIDNGPSKGRPAVLVRGATVKVPKLGWVKMRERVRFRGRILSVVINRTADHWYASFSVQLDHLVPPRTDVSCIGVDLGLRRLAALSDGSVVLLPDTLTKGLKRVRRLSRMLSRKIPGSANHSAAKIRLERAHERMTNVRGDMLHKLTSRLATYGTVVVEDLNVRGMLKNRRIARAVSFAGFFEFRRQLQYKVALTGSHLVFMNRWFPSSKRCSKCTLVRQDLRWEARTWTCMACGSVHDRDINAAQNLVSCREFPGASLWSGELWRSITLRETSCVEAGRCL